MIRLLIVIVLMCGTAQAESFTASALTDADAMQTVASIEPQSVVIQPANDPVKADIWEVAGLKIQNPDMTSINGILEDLQKLNIQAGSDFSLPMQWRIAELPEPFPGSQWPTAELRSAKSPAGVVLATYTITVISTPLVKWSLDLSAAQTAALSGKKGFTEMKVPYDVDVYYMFVRIPTEINPSVTQ